jgi:hemoglobin
VRLTIYDRCGGFSTVRRVVSDFYDRVLDSALLAKHFEDVQMTRLMDHQTRFIAYLMGGPASYTDDHLERVHGRLGITKPEFEEMVALLRETLEEHDFERADIELVDQELRRRERLVVTA